MRKAIVSLFVVGLLGGPLASASQAGVFCTLQEKLGVNNIKECEDYLP
ncbi:MAG: hypothetical protein ACRDKT_05150 [Actinomycetota bacterium]